MSTVGSQSLSADPSGVTRAEFCAVACAEVFRGDGEVMASAFGTAPALGARLARLTFAPDLVLTDGDAAETVLLAVNQWCVGEAEVGKAQAEIVHGVGRKRACPVRNRAQVIRHRSDLSGGMNGSA